MTDVVLIRPGCTDFDEQSRIQGSLDLPLNERGREQLRAIVDRLSELDLDILYASPCEPARSTAATIASEIGVQCKELDDLENLNHGLWQGLPIEEVRRKFPKVFKQWQESPETICPPQGETILDAVDRVRKALVKPLKRKKRIGIVASEPLATLIRCVVCGQPPALPEPLCSCTQSALVEVLVPQTNGSTERTGNGTVHRNGNGIAGNGALGVPAAGGHAE
jgi:probable phosphoglycerate mutase